MKQKQFDAAVAKLRLQPGDSLLLDARAFDPSIVRSLRGPKNCMIYFCQPRTGETLKDCFQILLEAELKTLTREKLNELLDETA